MITQNTFFHNFCGGKKILIRYLPSTEDALTGRYTFMEQWDVIISMILRERNCSEAYRRER